ncbi:hypothetical protein TNCT_575271 [Trichonephila clavata]|uniref:Uncharacterized protein n=1 Tax=Trichonephila clavata TaxID=2740835 RepID=A0A8X6M0B7_TRICU|nr:hypothetical protein TNCT_575271 [Trichonephila clavata]
MHQCFDYKLVISSSIKCLEALHFSGCLDQMFVISVSAGHINCTTLWWLLGIQVYSNHSLPGQHQLCLKRYTSAAVLTKSVVISVATGIPPSILIALHFSGCLVYKFSHISHCQDTIKCSYSAAL